MDFINSWQIKMDIGDYQLIGYSRGSFKTGLMIEPLKIFLDAGVCSQYEPNLILITHGHSDHIGEIYNILIGNTRKYKVPIMTPPSLTKLISFHINSHKSLNRGYVDKYTLCDVIGLSDKYNITIQGKKLEIEPFKMDHTVCTIGFGVSEVRDKLKSEYIGKNTVEIIELKKITKITEEKIYPMFLFCGDTGSSILDSLPFDKYPIVIIEATFLNNDHKQEAIDRKHLHITDLQPYFERFKETKFILIHFSSRYTLEEIKTYQSIWENMCGNVKFFISNIVNPI